MSTIKNVRALPWVESANWKWEGWYGRCLVVNTKKDVLRTRVTCDIGGNDLKKMPLVYLPQYQIELYSVTPYRLRLKLRHKPSGHSDLVYPCPPSRASSNSRLSWDMPVGCCLGMYETAYNVRDILSKANAVAEYLQLGMPDGVGMMNRTRALWSLGLITKSGKIIKKKSK